MKMKDKPIHSLYCVYLLRSLEKETSLYVGSTPHPRRRLKQHNGILQGGAHKTSTKDKRPWEMIALISGFPSKLAALQFEWAWQHTHLSRHIPKEDRSITKTRKRKNTNRPGHSIDTEPVKIRTLQILFKATSFRRWPLKARFFAKSCHDAWNKPSIEELWCTRNGVVPDLDPSAEQSVPMDAVIKPNASEEQKKIAFKQRPTTQAIYAIDASYNGVRDRIKRSISTLQGNKQLQCSVCTEHLSIAADMITVCPSPTCCATSHLSCLGQSFLAGDPTRNALLPVRGQCPMCAAELQWVDLVKDLSLRIRAPEVVEKLLKVPKTNGKAVKDSDTEDDDADNDSDSDEDVDYDASFAEDALDDAGCNREANEVSEDDLPPPPPKKQKTPTPSPRFKKTAPVRTVIPDSDDYEEIEEFG